MSTKKEIFENRIHASKNNQATEEKSSFFASYELAPAAWFKRNDDTFFDEGYQKNVVAYRCVKEIADNLATLKWVLKKKTSGKVIDNHPLIELLNRPNPMQGRAAFFQTLQTFKQLSGNTYIQTIRPSDNRPPKELYVLPSSRVQVIPGKMMIPTRYEYRPRTIASDVSGTMAAKVYKFDVDPITGLSDILHMKTINPLDDWVGQSPLEAAAFSIDLHNQASEWNMRLLQNGARPSGGLFVEKTLSPEQREQLKEAFNDVYAGAKNAGRPMVLEGNVKWQDMSLSPKDMDFMNSKNVAARDIATAFRVPPLLLNIAGDNTYANMAEARLSLWEDTLIPEADMIRDELNNWLVPMFGDNLYLDYDKDQIVALSGKRKEVWDTVNNADFLTINEKREKVGYERIEGGDDLFPSEPVVPVEDVITENGSPAEATSPTKNNNLILLEVKNEHSHEIDLTVKNGSTTVENEHSHSYTIGANKTGIVDGHSHKLPNIEWVD